MSRFRNLVVWQESITLAERAYQLVENFSDSDKAILGKDICITAMSVASNIAEGAGKNDLVQYIEYLGRASGASNRIISQAIVAGNLDILNEDDSIELENQANKISNMLHNFKVSLEKKMREDEEEQNQGGLGM